MGYITSALFANSAPTSWGLLDKKSEVVSGQAAFSFLVALATLMPVLAHRYLTGKGWVRKEGWEVGLAFGLLWGTGWAVFERVSPFGRYSVPSLDITSTPVAAINRLLGPAGVDVLLGTTAYAAYQTGNFLLPAVQAQIEDTRSSSGASSSRSSFVSTVSSRFTSPARTPPWDAQASETSSLLPSPASQSSASDSRSSGGSSRTARSARGSRLAGAATATLWAVLYTLQPSGDLQPLSASLNEQTPFGIGYVLPPVSKGHSSPSIDTIIHEAQTIGNRANLLVFPETVLNARTAFERYDAIDRMIEEGSWGEEDGVEVKREGRRNEVVLIGPDGAVGDYSKQKHIPYIESYPLLHTPMKVPTWEIDLPAPRGVNRTDWTPKAPHIRTIRISPAICLDSFHPALFGKLDPLPDIITISASAPTYSLGRHILGRAESMALTHSVPVVLVASGKRGLSDGSGVSALLDAWGRHLHLQRGGRSIVVQMAVPYGDGKARRRSGAEWLGTTGVLGAGVVLLVVAAGLRQSTDRNLIAGAGGEGDSTPHLGSHLSLHTIPETRKDTLSSASTNKDDTGDPPRRTLRRSQQTRLARSAQSTGYGAIPNTSSTADSAGALLIHQTATPESPTPRGGRRPRLYD